MVAFVCVPWWSCCSESSIVAGGPLARWCRCTSARAVAGSVGVVAGVIGPRCPLSPRAPFARHGAQVGGTLARVANSGQFVNSHCPFHAGSQSGCVFLQVASLHLPVVAHLSQSVGMFDAFRMALITGRQTAFAAAFAGSLSESYMRDISSLRTLPNWFANGWNICTVFPCTVNVCLPESGAVLGAGASGGGCGCWLGGSMPVLNAWPPWCWAELYCVLRCWS